MLVPKSDIGWPRNKDDRDDIVSANKVAIEADSRNHRKLSNLIGSRFRASWRRSDCEVGHSPQGPCPGQRPSPRERRAIEDQILLCHKSQK